jgi:hypothetical protein
LACVHTVAGSLQPMPTQQTWPGPPQRRQTPRTLLVGSRSHAVPVSQRNAPRQHGWPSPPHGAQRPAASHACPGTEQVGRALSGSQQD